MHGGYEFKPGLHWQAESMWNNASGCAISRLNPCQPTNRSITNIAEFGFSPFLNGTPFYVAEMSHRDVVKFQPLFWQTLGKPTKSQLQLFPHSLPFTFPLLYTSPPNFADRQNVDPAAPTQLRSAPSFCTQGGRPLCSPWVTVSQYPTIKLKVKCPHSKHNTVRSQPYKGSALSANKANSYDHIQYVLMDSGSKCRNTDPYIILTIM